MLGNGNFYFGYIIMFCYFILIKYSLFYMIGKTPVLWYFFSAFKHGFNVKQKGLFYFLCYLFNGFSCSDTAQYVRAECCVIALGFFYNHQVLLHKPNLLIFYNPCLFQPRLFKNTIQCSFGHIVCWFSGNSCCSFFYWVFKLPM